MLYLTKPSSVKERTTDGQNNGKTIQYRYTRKNVCVGCVEAILFVSIFRCSFFLRCVVPVSMYCRMCLVTVRMKLLQNGRLVSSSKTVGAHLAGASVTKKGHFIRCIQSSGFQGYDSTHIMGKHHQLRGTVAQTQNFVNGIAVH